MYDQLYHYFTENYILYRYQSGFRSLHSTATALLEAMDCWAMNIDRGFVNVVVFPRFKKALDTEDHNILLTKLQFYRIRNFCHKWLTSYSTLSLPNVLDSLDNYEGPQ